MGTLSLHERRNDIHNTLIAIHDAGTPIEYDTDPLVNLIVITDSIASLCWNIETAAKRPSSPHPTSLCGQDIIEESTKIVGICLTELDNMRKGIKRVSVTIVSDCADSCLYGGYPLDSLDIAIDPSERIKRLIEATGKAAPYWVHTTDINNTEVACREETIAMLAYHAACAIIATKHQLIAG